MKDVVSVFECSCKKRTIMLDENMQGFEIAMEDILCPSCGNEMVEESSVDLTIGSVRDDKKAWKKVLDLKNKINHDNESLTKEHIRDVKFLLSLLDE